MKYDFLPIILGTDSNAYGMAKAFHMAYGIKSLVVGQGELFTTTGSKILTLKIIPDLVNPDKFPQHLTALASELKDSYKHLILIASSDGYVELIVNNKAALSKDYIVPFIDAALMQTLNSKESFYEVCEKYGLSYPMTRVIAVTDLDKLDAIVSELPFGYPLVLKPSDSMRYFEASFEGKQKAYILETPESLKEAIVTIYKSSYDRPLILQEYIAGDDTSMRVLNCLSGPDGKVKLMCLGQPLLEDCTPTLVGNYTAIIDAFDSKIFEEYKQFLERIGYIGFSNFDMKYDVRTDTFKVFEINLRQGRSSFFVTGSGYNQAAYLVDAFVHESPYETVYADKPHLWLGMSSHLLKKYLTDRNLRKRVDQLIMVQNISTTLNYKKDSGILRNLRVNRYYHSYTEKYKKYYAKKN